MTDSSSISAVKTLLHAVLRRGHELISCEVTTRGRRHYEVHVVPVSDMSTAVVESFDKVAKAVRRHAELSWLLRESGWEPMPADEPVHPATAA